MWNESEVPRDGLMLVQLRRIPPHAHPPETSLAALGTRMGTGPPPGGSTLASVAVTGECSISASDQRRQDDVLDLGHVEMQAQLSEAARLATNSWRAKAA